MKTKICLVIMTLLLILSGCGKKEEEKKQETISDYEQYLSDTSYVEKDPTAFFTTKQFEKGYEAMKQFCFVRAASIQKQLNGTLSTRSDDQDPSQWADASGIDLLDMN
jgi:uncharacterized lipoprotein